MAPLRREVLLIICASIAGCAGSADSDPSTSDSPTGSEPATETPRTHQTETPVFAIHSTDGLPSECPEPDYAYYATTAVPYPTPSASVDKRSAIQMVMEIEAAYLDNWTILTRSPYPTPTADPETPHTHKVEYPDASAEYESRSVIQRSEHGFVVHLEYERVVNGDSLGHYTVNYYLTAEKIVRAEREGYHDPGPNPTTDGTLLEC